MPSIEQNRQALQAGIKAGTLIPADAPSTNMPPGMPDVGDTKTPRAIPFLRAPVPSPFQMGQDTFQAFQKNTLPGSRVAPLPPSLTTAIGASAKSQIIIEKSSGSAVTFEVNNNPVANQNLINFIGDITSDAFGNIVFNSSGDGLTHGSTPWETDASFFSRRDDFSFLSAGNASGYWGETSFFLVGSGVTAAGLSGTLEHPGILVLYINTATANSGAVLLPGPQTGAPLSPSNTTLPLLDYPGWKESRVLCFQRPAPVATPSATAFSMAHQSIYLGLGNSYLPSASVLPLRPPIFLGLRYDTDPGFSMSIQSIAAASGGKTVYTISSTTLGPGLPGNKITVASATSPANNGTFLCVAATTVTLTLLNAGGVVQSGAAGTASTPAISDTTFKFEYVANPLLGVTSRNNTQGQVHDTGVTPTEGVWYRLDMECTAIGVVTLTLTGNGSQLATWTVTATTVLWGTTTSSSATVQSGNNAIEVGPDGTTFNGTNMFRNPFGIGSHLVLGGTAPNGMTVGNTYINAGDATSQTTLTFFLSGTSAGNVGATFTGYPAFLLGWASMATDTSGSHVEFTSALLYDFFGFVWNPGLAGAAANAGYSRFFSGT